VVVGSKRRRASFQYPPQHLALAADGKQLLLVERTGAGLRVCVDGKKGPVFKYISVPPRFALGSKTYAYVGKKEASGKDYVVIDGTVGQACRLTPGGGLVFSPDGRRVAYSAFADGKTYVYDGDRKLGPYPAVEWLTYSPDGKHLAFLVSAGTYDKNLIVEGRVIEKVRGPIEFSADGKTIGYGKVMGNEIWWKVTELEGAQ
jgi:hypothetical protein